MSRHSPTSTSTSEPRPTLEAPLADQLPGAADPEAIDRVWRRLEATRAERASSGRSKGAWRLPAGLAAAATAAAAIAVAFWPFERPGPAPGYETIVRLSATSHAELAAGAAMDVTADDLAQVSLRLEAGQARFVVDPEEQRLWTVTVPPPAERSARCTPVTVTVVGTVFEVARSDDGVTVAVERGVVDVSPQGAPAEHRLRTDERLETPYPCGTRVSEAAEDDTSVEGPADDTVPEADSPSGGVTSPSAAKRLQARRPLAERPKGDMTPTEGPSNSTLPEADSPSGGVTSPSSAKRLRARRALAERPDGDVTPTGGPSNSTVPEAASPSDDTAPSAPPTWAELLADADRLHAAGDRSGAIALVTSALRTRASEPGAGLAAYSLADWHREAGRLAKAAATFERAVRLGLPSALREPAAWNALTLWGQAGDAERGAAAAARYLRTHPSGPHAAEARGLAGAGEDASP